MGKPRSMSSSVVEERLGREDEWDRTFRRTETEPYKEGRKVQRETVVYEKVDLKVMAPPAPKKTFKDVSNLKAKSNLAVVNWLLPKINYKTFIANYSDAVYDGQVSSKLLPAINEIFSNLEKAKSPEMRLEDFKGREGDVSALRWLFTSFGGPNLWKELATMITSCIIRETIEAISKKQLADVKSNIDWLYYYYGMLEEDSLFTELGGPLLEGEERKDRKVSYSQPINTSIEQGEKMYLTRAHLRSQLWNAIWRVDEETRGGQSEALLRLADSSMKKIETRAGSLYPDEKVRGEIHASLRTMTRGCRNIENRIEEEKQDKELAKQVLKTLEKGAYGGVFGALDQSPKQEPKQFAKDAGKANSDKKDSGDDKETSTKDEKKKAARESRERAASINKKLARDARERALENNARILREMNEVAVFQTRGPRSPKDRQEGAARITAQAARDEARRKSIVEEPEAKARTKQRRSSRSPEKESSQHDAPRYQVRRGKDNELVLARAPRSAGQAKQSKPETLGDKIKAAFQVPVVEYRVEPRESRHGSSPSRSNSKASPPTAPAKERTEHKRQSTTYHDERDIRTSDRDTRPSDRPIGLGLRPKSKTSSPRPHGIHGQPLRYSPPGTPYIPEARQQSRQTRSPSPIRYRVLPPTPGAPINFSRKQVSPGPQDRPTSPISEFGGHSHPLESHPIERPPIGSYFPATPKKKAGEEDAPMWKQLQDDERKLEEWRQSKMGPHEPARHSRVPEKGILKPKWAGELRRKKSVGFTPSTKMTESLRREVEREEERRGRRGERERY